MIVHGRANSSNVQKVLWLLDELGLPFERIDRGGRFGGLDDPEYLALNPNARVPTVVDGDLVLWESHAILRHYARRHGAFFPEDPAGAARTDMVLDWTHTTLWVPLRAAYVAVEREGLEPGADTVVRALDAVETPLDCLEGLLRDRDWVGGAGFGIGDIPPAVCLDRWLHLGRSLGRWPAVAAWHVRAAARPAYRARVFSGG